MPKKISKNDIIGDQGIALIHRIVGEMGFIWTPTGLEAGIDGYIEIRDIISGQVSNMIIQVQSKATARDFVAETSEGFDYYCDQEDLDYWLGGNSPVILVRSRPSTNEAYWVSIKDYFHDLNSRSSRKIHFNKIKDSFNVKARDSLSALAKPKESGIYLTPLPKQEELYSNLLKVVGFSKKIYVAETEFRYPTPLRNRLSEMSTNYVGGEWILKNKRIISFNNLEEHPWCELCDQGTSESFDSEEWAYAEEPEKEQEFVQLLNLSLVEKVKPHVKYHEDLKLFFFAPTDDLTPRSFRYQSAVQQTSRTVFLAYPNKKHPQKTEYYRHSSFKGHFSKFDDEWFLEITPTYYFTYDGYRTHGYHAELLKGIKKLERNSAVMGQVIMWAEYLNRQEDMFTSVYPYLTFGSLCKFAISAGIDDDSWLKREEDQTNNTPSSLLDLPMFNTEDDNENLFS